jgi:TatA/E family protein of Tat protein translocase
MFGLGFWELVVIAVVALLFIGPDKMPNFFRALGRATREFQRASRELRENLSLDEPPAPLRRYPPRKPPPTDVHAEPALGDLPRPPSRQVELPKKVPDQWPEALPIPAESKPSEPFDTPAPVPVPAPVPAPAPAPTPVPTPTPTPTPAKKGDA